ncbi:type II toxin-antitoxin system VapC family toxin [candidate division KSB1 bacterium]|nr:type II toxin-antitoxin system VapC family toxin [candidate division KSB1 bacterium]
MNLVDSSGWLEYFTDGKNSEIFSKPLNNKEELIVPSIILYEVFMVVLREKDENTALQVIATMQQCKVIELSSEIAIQAAKLSHEKNLPMADSIILATGILYDAVIWTQDADFKNISYVKYFSKK